MITNERLDELENRRSRHALLPAIELDELLRVYRAALAWRHDHGTWQALRDAIDGDKKENEQ